MAVVGSWAVIGRGVVMMSEFGCGALTRRRVSILDCLSVVDGNLRGTGALGPGLSWVAIGFRWNSVHDMMSKLAAERLLGGECQYWTVECG